MRFTTKFFIFYIFLFLFHLKSYYSIINNTKIKISDPKVQCEEDDLTDYSKYKDVDNLYYFYDIKFAYNRLRVMKQFFFDKLNQFNMILKKNLTENDIFKKFEDLNAVYKYQVTCSLCKKTFKTSQYLWIHTTRSHVFDKYNETDMQSNIFWVASLFEFLDWENVKNNGNKQDFDFRKEVYLKFKKCLLFGINYIDYNDDFKQLYDFCLEFYFEKESKGKFQDFLSTAYQFFFKILLVVFIIVTIIYYSFAYYIYIEAHEQLDFKNKNENN